MGDLSKKAGSFLQSQSYDLQQLFLKIKERDTLNQKISAYLPAEIQNDCHVSRVAQDKLIIITTDTAVAMKLRYFAPNLLQQFQCHSELKTIKQIQCKIDPMLKRMAQESIKPVSHLSQTTAELIRETASTLDDPRLREIMERIATRTKT